LTFLAENTDKESQDYKKIKNREKVIRLFVKFLSESVHKMHICKEFKITVVQTTIDEGMRLDCFDTKSGYLGFLDGVYSFKENRLLKCEESEDFFMFQIVLC
jgi:hypothetical protein